MHNRLVEPLEPRTLLAVTTIGVIGDYGTNSPAEADTANLIKSWNPEYITTVGDNNYPVGGADTIDINIGQYFHEYMLNYPGTYGPGSPTQRFYPALGNHDWDTPGATPYLDYFDLPGNERYYEWTAGPVHFFMVDSDTREPHGTSPTSIQGQWLQSRLAASIAPFKLVLMHHPPYSSGTAHGDNAWMQWPFAQWGSTAVLGGHEHIYERINRNGIPHFIDGLGGASIHNIGTPVTGSEYRYNADYGAMRLDADDVAGTLTYRFYTRAGTLIDMYTQRTGNAIPSVTVAATDSSVSETGANAGMFTFTRTGSTAAGLTVNFTLSGSAQNALDFAAIPTTVTFAPGASTATVPITPYDDPLVEGTESLVLTLEPQSQFNRAAAYTASLDIADDDSYSLILPGGSTWRYLDNGSDQGTAWRATNFPGANSWPTGGARFGYGDPNMVTTINGGPSGNRFITHYFRMSVNVTNPEQIDVLNLRLLRDDGVILYINGTEAARSNMPAGAVTSQTLASSAVGGTDETTFFTIALDPALFVPGTNVLAVELHQSSTTTSDAVFDMYMEAVFDSSAPAAPSVPDLAAASDSGVSDEDDLTNTAAPRFTGTAEPGTTVEIFADGNLVGSGTSIGGFYDITISSLLDGEHLITARAADPVGNVGAISVGRPIVIDTSPPELLSSDFLDDIAPMGLRVTFDSDVGATVALSDLLLQNLTAAGVVNEALMSLAYDAPSRTATITFPGFPGGLLPDARYRATLLTSGISDPAGNLISPAPPFAFHHLIGDANRDGQVGVDDFNILATNFNTAGKSFSQGNFDYDPAGNVNLEDFNLLAGKFGVVLATRAPSFSQSRVPRLTDALRLDLLD